MRHYVAFLQENSRAVSRIDGGGSNKSGLQFIIHH